MGNYLNARGAALRKKVARAATTLNGKARMITIIAEAFGIKATDVKSNLSTASDNLKARKPESKPNI